MNKLKIKCIVAATNSNGNPDFFPVIVQGTYEELNDGGHYGVAIDAAENAGYKSHLAYDENDTVADPLFKNYDWANVTVVTI